MTLEIILISIISLLIFISFILFIKLSISTRTISHLLAKVSFLEEKLGRKLLNTDKQVENTDGFIKFISESRDLAFSYIEEAQKGISKFVNNAGPEIEYFSKFGPISEGQPLHDSMVKISAEYEDLKKLLPADYGKID